jgi:NAD(P)-dependent dehydrogenase (short-subunit alcohol dehydrogenase family)
MNVLVTGAAAGLGFHIAGWLEEFGHKVLRFDKSINPKMDVRECDQSTLESLYGPDFKCDAIVNNAGVNQNAWFEDVTKLDFYRVIGVNAWGTVNMTQAVLSRLKQSEHKVVLNVVSNASQLPMTASLAYNASKAAQAMITKQMARELTPKYGITVLAVSPNKLEGTDMSRQIETNVPRVRGWTEEYAREYQLGSLMHGRETDPFRCGEFIADILHKGHYRFLSGCDLSYGK